MPSTSTLSSSSLSSSSLKTRLKKWEHQFKSTEGRMPNKADIKANPEIAQMYHTYNASRKGPRISDDVQNLSSINKIDNQLERTPNRTEKTTRLALSPPQSVPKFTSKIQSTVNSPRKLGKLVQEHQSPRKFLNNHVNGKSQGRSIHSKQTPNQLISQNPFDLDSGGGKGSPNLFADLLLESAKETPRTKARKFLGGIGSPLKRTQLSNSENMLNLDDQNVRPGLSSFLKQTAKTSKTPLKEKAVDHDHDNDADDEVLGPSPFKPVSNAAFQPLFDNPMEDDSEHHTLVNSPSKSINSKWKKISTIPFIPQSQNHLSNVDQVYESAKIEPGQVEKRTSVGLGIKRKRVVVGSGEEEFYKNLPELSKPETKLSISSLNKKKKIQKSSSKSLDHQTKVSNDKPHNNAHQSDLTINRRIKAMQLTSSLLDQPDSEIQEAAEESISTLKDLPHGNPDQPPVYAELENFQFARPSRIDAKDDAREESHQINMMKSVNEKGKGKLKNTLDHTTTKPVKLGTQKVLVRAYRPIEPNQLTKIDPTPTDFQFDIPNQPCDANHEIDVNEHCEDEVEESGEEDDNQKYNLNQQSNAEEDSEAEADLQISEDLMNVLNIDDNLTIEGEDRSHLLRELKREQKVREILEGKRSTIFERTFTRLPRDSTSVNPFSNSNKKSSKSRNSKSNQIKPNQKSFYTTAQNISGQSYRPNTLDNHHQENDDDSLQFELGLDELQNQEQIESHLYGDDDDWEDEPSGWKKAEQLVDFCDDVDD